MPQDPIVFYTDGSADAKSLFGSWAYIRVENGLISTQDSKRVKKTNSARMEMTAVIEALSTLHSQSSVIIHTDCRMLVEAMVKFVPAWKANGWRKPNRDREIPYRDLYERLDELANRHQVQWVWVKAHSGNTYNEFCDHLCRLARLSNC